MRDPKRWALVGAVLLIVGLLVSGTARPILIAVGMLLLVQTVVGAFRDESRPEPPVPPGSGSGPY